MKIVFLGASRTVTGSCYVVEANGKRFAVDCGMHQGNKDIEKRNWDMNPYAPEELDFLLVTHAHIDHTGLIPRLTKFGFKGKVYATRPTLDLMEIMLLDSAHIQEMEADWENRKRSRHGQAPVDPLYVQADAQTTFPFFSPVEYGETFEPAPGVRVTYQDAGHILGSAFIKVEVEEEGQWYTLVFSGDLGRPNQLLMRDPEVATRADYLFIESTYGDRDHKNEANSREELAEAIAYSYRNKEKVIIPAFAVERSQEIIYSLFMLFKEGRLPADMPVYLDSPLAIRATEIFRKHPEFLDEATRKLIESGEHPLDLPNLQYTQTAPESKAINETREAAVVISASGMCNAGRIKHHLRHNLWRKGASVVFVGFQAQGTPGRKIVDGAKKIRIFGEEVAVAAKIFTIGGFSAHAGRSQILDWLGNFENESMTVMLVHGEHGAQESLAAAIRERHPFEVAIPDYLEERVLRPGEAPEIQTHPDKARPRIDWQFLLSDTDRLLAEFKSRVAHVGEKAWVDQTEVRDKVLDLNRLLTELSSEL